MFIVDDFVQILKSDSLKIGIDINESQLKKFNIYFKFLVEYNNHTNLTSVVEPGMVAVKHFVDSFLITKVITLSDNDEVIDIGTGAGFPGMAVKILNPSINITLVDSLNKKINFLNELKNLLGIEARVFHKRAEDLSRNPYYRDKFDYCVSRAVASLNILVEYCMPFVKDGGYFVAMKGPNVEDEIKNSLNAIKALGGKLEKTEKMELPGGLGKRSIILIKKFEKTREEYPRQTAKIIKRPL